MRRIRFLSGLRARIVGLALASVLPLAVLAVVNLRGAFAEEREQASARSLATARVIAGRLDDYLSVIGSVLLLAERAVGSSPTSVAETDSLLRQLDRELPSYIDNLTMWSPEGINIGHSRDPSADTARRSVADRRYFQQALARKRLSVGEPVVSRSTGQWTISLARPMLRPDSSVYAVMAAAFLLNRMSGLIRTNDMPEGSVIVVVDRDGLIVARSADPERWVGRDVRTLPSFRYVLTHETGVAELRGVDRILRISGFVPVRGAPWIVVVGIPSDVAYATARTELARNAAVVAAALLLSLLFAMQLAGRITRPIVRLTRDAEALGAGDLAHRARREGRGEIGVLARSFNQMAESVDSRQRALEIAESRYRLLFERNPAPMWVYHRHTLAILAVNDAAVAHYGYARDEFLGMSITDLRTPDEMPRLQQEIHRGREASRHVAGMHRHRRKDGSEIMVEVVAHSVIYDEQPARLVLAFDVTEREHTQLALRASEEQYRVVTEGVPILIADCDRDGRLRFVNRAFEETVGKRRDALRGATLREVLGEDAWGAFVAHLDAVLAGQAVTFDTTIRDAGGVLRTVAVSLVPGRVSGGQVAGFYALFSDVTHRAELEEQLRQAQKMESVGRLAGGISHDFNNLLTVILSCAGFARQEVPPGTQAYQDLAEIEQAATRAGQLTRQLLAFARREVIQPRVLNLNEVTSDVDRMLRRLLGEHVELVTILEPSPWSVRADPSQMEQILVNLAVNARDAMAGGGRLTIETANVTFDEAYVAGHAEVAPGEYVMIAVSDSGPGIPDDVRPHIFEPFFTTKRGGLGTGLGLATCYGIVKQNGGVIWAYSEPGRGATFKIYLPRVVATPEQRSETASPVSAGGRERVLVVEDDPIVRSIAVRALRGAGYLVLEAGNGVEALEVSAAEPSEIALLVTDVVMPQIGGRELARRLLVLRPGIRILFTSGYTENAIVHNGELDTGIAFLQKPYVGVTLTQKVRAVLDAEEQARA